MLPRPTTVRNSSPRFAGGPLPSPPQSSSSTSVACRPSPSPSPSPRPATNLGRPPPIRHPPESIRRPFSARFCRYPEGGPDLPVVFRPSYPIRDHPSFEYRKIVFLLPNGERAYLGPERERYRRAPNRTTTQPALTLCRRPLPIYPPTDTLLIRLFRLLRLFSLRPPLRRPSDLILSIFFYNLNSAIH